MLEEPLFGAPEESVWLGSGEEGPVLATLGLRTGLTRAELEELLALPFPGITPLVAVGELDQPGPEADNVVVVVETPPAGVVSTQASAALRGDARLRAGRSLRLPSVARCSARTTPTCRSPESGRTPCGFAKEIPRRS